MGDLVLIPNSPPIFELAIATSEWETGTESVPQRHLGLFVYFRVCGVCHEVGHLANYR